MLACCCFVVSQLLIVITLIYLVITKSKVHNGTCSSATVLLPLPPGPWPWPVVGSLPELVLSKPAFRWIHRVMKDMGTDIACFRLGGVHVVPITCPKIAREVLKKQDKNFSSRPLTFASGAISSGYKDAVVTPPIQSYTNHACKCVRSRSETHRKISQHNSRHNLK